MRAFTAGMRRVALLAPATALALLLPVPAHAAAEETDAPPSGITLEVVTANGSGCKAGTVRTYVDRDDNGFRAYFDEFAAMVGDGAPPTAIRRNCQFNLRVSGVPDGYSYTVANAELRGYGHLSPGATGLQRTAYYFQGMTNTVYREHKFTGPYNNFWKVRDRGPTVWSVCHEQRNANINMELRVSPGADKPAPVSFMSMTSWEHRVFARFRLAWRTC
jgi:hypothetical protein